MFLLARKDFDSIAIYYTLHMHMHWRTQQQQQTLSILSLILSSSNPISVWPPFLSFPHVPLISLHNFLFHFLEASCAYHPSTNDGQYTLEQSHFLQIAPIEMLMVYWVASRWVYAHVSVW